MIEMVVIPGSGHMATFTGTVRIELFIQVSLVNIRMAVRAFFPDISELPFFPGIFLVAGETGGSQVGAVEGEFGFGVIGNRK